MSSSNLLLLVPLLLCIQLINSQDNNNFLWSPLLNISSGTFERAFLPLYVNFTSHVLQNAQITSSCRAAVQLALSSLRARQFWAVNLFNSWAKFPPTGTLRGTLTDFGDYDACLSLDEGWEEGTRAQYCLLDISVPMPRPMPQSHNYYHRAKVLPTESTHNLSSEHFLYLANGSVYQHLAEFSSVFYYAYIKIGVCWPRNCTTDDIAMAMRPGITQLGLELTKFSCEHKPAQWKLDNVQLCALAFFASTCLLAFIAALYDRLFYSKKRALDQLNFLIWFSPVRNIRKLIITKCKDDDLSCIHGMRVLTLIWIIMGHSVNWNSLNSFRDTFTLREKLTEMLPQPLYRGILTVDTFFFLSGLLTAYVTLKYTRGNYQRFNSWLFITLRYLRLTPQLGVFILFTLLLPALFDGPIWRSYISITDQCYTNWFINLLYLQNLVDVGNICGLHTWYLAADMQLHWISLLPVVLLLKNRQLGIALIKLLIVSTLAISCMTIYFQKLPPGSVITSNNDFFDENAMPKDYLRFVYKPWTHAYVFFIGFLFGDYIKNNLKLLKQITLSKPKKYLLWLAVFGSFGFSIYSTVPWLYGRPYIPIWSAILFPLNLLTWSFGMGLSIWLCVTNNAGVIGRMLSSTVFPPLSRMSYSVYLTHVWVVWVAAGARRHLIDLNIHSVLLLFAAEVLIAFVIGFIFTILFETPVITVLDYIKERWSVDESAKESGTGKWNGNGERDCKLIDMKLAGNVNN